MPIDPVKIPQNVYVEDRIIGPITLKQIIMLLIGGGTSYALWSAAQSNGASQLIQILAWIPCVVAAAFAFVKINGISLFRIVLLFIEKLNKPSIRTWSPREGIVINITTTKSGKHPQEKRKTKKNKEQEKEEHIETLTTLLDRGPQNEEGAEQEDESNPQPTKKKRRPVNPERIRADRKEGAPPIDSIAMKHETNDRKSAQENIIRDITPPA